MATSTINYLPFPDGVNPYRHLGQFYWWTDEQIESVYGPSPKLDDPRYSWTGQYGVGVMPIPPNIKDQSQLYKYLYAPPTGEQLFKREQQLGNIPENAIFKSYADNRIAFEVPTSQLNQAKVNIPDDATIKTQDSDKITYTIPRIESDVLANLKKVSENTEQATAELKMKTISSGEEPIKKTYKETPQLSEYIDNYFREKGWMGGDIPGTQITLANDSAKKMGWYNQHLTVAKDAYIKDFGQESYNKEVISTSAGRLLTLFPYLGAATPVIQLSVPLLKSTGVKGWSGVNLAEYATGVIGLLGIKHQVTALGEKVAALNQLQYLAVKANGYRINVAGATTTARTDDNLAIENAFKQALRDAHRNPVEADVSTSSTPTSKYNQPRTFIYGEGGVFNKPTYEMSEQVGKSLYENKLPKTPAKLGTIDYKGGAVKPENPLSTSGGDAVKFNYGDLNKPIFFKPDATGGGVATLTKEIDINIMRMTPENAAILAGLEMQVANGMGSPIVIAIPKLGGAVFIPAIKPSIHRKIETKAFTAISPSSISKIQITPGLSLKNLTNQMEQAVPKSQSQTVTKTAAETQTRTVTQMQTQAQTGTKIKPAEKEQVKTDVTIISPSTPSPGAIITPGSTHIIATGEIEIPPFKYVPPEQIKQLKKKLLKRGGKIGWKQGFMYIIVSYPYKSQKDVSYSRKKPAGLYLVKGAGSAYRTIRLITGEAPDFLTIAIGMFTATVSGAKPTLRFTRNKNNARLTIKGVRG
jgi:hypothetical protein